MRIVDFKTFTDLPAGTIYQEYEPYCTNLQLHVKGDTLRWDEDRNGALHKTGEAWDFIECALTGEFAANYDGFDRVLDDSLKNGTDIPLTFGEETTRWGVYDHTQLFAVWSDEDVAGLVKFLQTPKAERLRG